MAAKASNRFDNSKRRRPESHNRQAMLTPQYLIQPVIELLGGKIHLDPCTEPDNTLGAETFYCLPQDGCSLPWNFRSIFCNPPYGEAKDRWIDRCTYESSNNRCRKILLLIPNHSETRSTQKALQFCHSALFIQGRLKFGILRQNRRQWAASHGSILFGFNIDLKPLENLGTILYRR